MQWVVVSISHGGPLSYFSFQPVQFEKSFTIYLMPYNLLKNMLSLSLNKIFPSFLVILLPNYLFYFLQSVLTCENVSLVNKKKNNCLFINDQNLKVLL